MMIKKLFQIVGAQNLAPLGLKVFSSYVYISLLILCFIKPCFAATDNNSKLSAISKQIADAQKHLHETLQQQNTLQAELEQSEQSIGDLSNSIRNINTNIAKNDAQLKALTSQAQQSQQSLDKERSMLIKQIQIVYQNNRENYLKILLNQENPYNLSRMMMYYQYFSQAHLQSIKATNQTLITVQQTQTSVQENTEDLKKLLAQRIEQQQNLERSQQKRQQILNKLHSSAQTQAQRLEILQANKRALENVIMKLQQQQAQAPYTGSSNFAAQKGRLLWPTKGSITHRFGSIMTQNLRYNGVFIKAPEGQNIQAIANGKVVFANWLKGFGLLLIIDHGNGYMSLYAHCNSLYKKVGDPVSAKESIASVGNSGGETETGLLFQIRYNGTALDPTLWCK